jgi:predicted ATPase
MTFSAATVAAGLTATVVEVEAWCEGLARRNLFLHPCGISEWPDGTVATRYSFTHALYQHAWYERVTAAKRAQLHRDIGERQEKAYGKQAPEIASELAAHIERGRNYHQALHYLQQAAEIATQRSAFREAASDLTKALEFLKTLPDTPERQQQELDLQVKLGLAVQSARGIAVPEAEQDYSRVLELCFR